jgi:hypothetical protein
VCIAVTSGFDSRPLLHLRTYAEYDFPTAPGRQSSSGPSGFLPLHNTPRLGDVLLSTAKGVPVIRHGAIR